MSDDGTFSTYDFVDNDGFTYRNIRVPSNFSVDKVIHFLENTNSPSVTILGRNDMADESFVSLLSRGAEKLQQDLAAKMSEVDKQIVAKGTEISAKMDKELADAKQKVASIDSLIKGEVSVVAKKLDDSVSRFSSKVTEHDSKISTMAKQVEQIASELSVGQGVVTAAGSARPDGITYSEPGKGTRLMSIEANIHSVQSQLESIMKYVEAIKVFLAGLSESLKKIELRK